jgi:hypothetical protein
VEEAVLEDKDQGAERGAYYEGIHEQGLEWQHHRAGEQEDRDGGGEPDQERDDQDVVVQGRLEIHEDRCEPADLPLEGDPQIANALDEPLRLCARGVPRRDQVDHGRVCLEVLDRGGRDRAGKALERAAIVGELAVGGVDGDDLDGVFGIELKVGGQGVADLTDACRGRQDRGARRVELDAQRRSAER